MFTQLVALLLRLCSVQFKLQASDRFLLKKKKKAPGVVQTRHESERGEARRSGFSPRAPAACRACVLVGVSDRQNGLFMGRLIAFMAPFLLVNGAGGF